MSRDNSRKKPNSQKSGKTYFENTINFLRNHHQKFKFKFKINEKTSHPPPKPPPKLRNKKISSKVSYCCPRVKKIKKLLE